MTDTERIMRKLRQIDERLDEMATALDRIFAVFNKLAKKAKAKKKRGEN